MNHLKEPINSNIKFIRNYTSTEQLDNIEADIEQCIKHNQHFVAFVLIALGIEYLGALLDDKEFADLGQSKQRFTKGLKLFKNEMYKENSDLLFKEFRGALLHQYRPGINFILAFGDPNKHLTKNKEATILIAEVFFEDFQNAKKAYLKRKDTGGANRKKAELPYMFVGSETFISIECPSGNPSVRLVEEIKAEPKNLSKKKKHKRKYHN